jgi:aspartate/glutamate racemase
VSPDEIRAVLLSSARADARVLITNTRNGSECIAVGIVKSLSTTHVVVSWMTGETIVPLASITDVTVQRRDNRDTQPK